MEAVKALPERIMAMDGDCYIDTVTGVDDPTADGSETRPYNSLSYAFIRNLDKRPSRYLVPAWKEPSKSAIKKAQGALDAHKKKLAAQHAREEEQRGRRLQRLEEAKDVVLKEDQSLPKATKVTIGHKDVKLGDEETQGLRVKVSGRIHHLRPQKHATFITLADGYGFLQCVLAAGDLTKSYDAVMFALGTSLTVYGEMKKVPASQSAPDNRELHVDYYKVIGHAPADKEALTNRVSASQNQWDSQMLDHRHLVLRGENASSLIKTRAALELAFIQFYAKAKFTKLSPPALVQTQVEGGSTLFKVPYYDEDAYLTQTSQLYLETALPSFGNVYCIEKSFRAEKSLTRRHLSEYTHVEAEMDFIEFSDLLDHLEEIICSVIDTVLADDEIASYIRKMNPGFEAPSRPFLRMRYSDAIDWLNSQDPPILNEFDAPHTFGDDIAEAAERKMTDIINRPIFLTHFPADLKAFYMKKDSSDLRVTESVDVLMPGVGEIVGASMRMEDYDELMDAFKRHGISPDAYYWYNDQRRYGTSPHGGYGLGLERLLAWVCKQHTVRTCCMYPRFMGRCRP
ncbi:asparaginyl-tRNA synthetase [Apiosordaria backusii]|uniref:asparagine--tRNA ligase n=1 Tax=Apiosordaria backusii TaxID=314023 RepID=A0AA40E3I7_9PEZI|nr:asparaginyl-tRNA synthetase [Apiosordaria backusii]